MSNSLDAGMVEALFDDWIDMLIAHYGDKTVAEVLSSPAIQACFTGDIGQWAQAHDKWCVDRHDEAGKCLNVYQPGRE